jgi:hypothetical protein
VGVEAIVTFALRTFIRQDGPSETEPPMSIRRLFVPLLAVMALLPLAGCGCNRCCSSNSPSYAPPASCPRVPPPPPPTVLPSPPPQF